jgi:ribonuclease P protein component
LRKHPVRRVLDEGRPLRGKRVVLLLAPGAGRCAAVASKRIGGAVERNRARRVLRAAWRETGAQLDEDDVVLVARGAIRGAKTQDLVAEMTKLLREREAVRS